MGKGEKPCTAAQKKDDRAGIERKCVCEHCIVSNICMSGVCETHQRDRAGTDRQIHTQSMTDVLIKMSSMESMLGMYMIDRLIDRLIEGCPFETTFSACHIFSLSFSLSV